MTPQTKGPHVRKSMLQDREREIAEAQTRYHAELLLAAQRFEAIQPTASQSERAMRWLLMFSTMDLDKLSEGKWSDLRYEINFLAHVDPSDGSGRQDVPSMAPEEWRESPDPEELGDAFAITQFEILRRLPSKMTVRRLQKDLCGDLRGLVSGKEVTMRGFVMGKEASFELPVKTREFVQVVEGRIDGIQTRWAHRFLALPDPADAFRHHSMVVLGHHGHALAHCPGCSTLFFADRRNKEFCTPACGNRHRMREKRKVRPERFGKRGRLKTLKSASAKGSKARSDDGRKSGSA
jgi:hypothetical protein